MAWSAGPTHVGAQQLNVGNVFNSTIANNTQHGINAAYMFHQVLDENYVMQPEMEAALIGTDFDVVRFPGGAIGNYYRFNRPGYGAVRNEVENVANTVNCNGTGQYCFVRDEFAPQNFIYDFIDLMENKYTATGKRTDVLYMLNLLLHFVYNYNEIPALDAITNLTELDEALGNGDISADFHERILENYNAMAMIIQHPDMRMTGIEMGNEFYFYQEVTTFPYPPTNSNPFFNLNSALNTVEPRIANYLTLINFYKRLVHALDPSIKIGVPIGGINHFGNQANCDLMWNTAIKQWVIQDVDALIPHLYMKTTAPEVHPPTAAADDAGSDMTDIRESFEESLDVKFLGILREIAEFFDLDSDFRELWMTEYNVNKNASNSQIWDEWTNTYLHGAFLNEMMKRMSASEYSDYLRYTIQHNWTGSGIAYEHCLLTRQDDGGIVNRVAHHTNRIADYLKSQNTVKLSGSLSDDLASSDFWSDAYYTYDQDGPACPVERFILSFTNLRSMDVSANLGFPNGQMVINGKTFNIVESRLTGMRGEDASSSCGRTEFDDSEDRYNITAISGDIDVSQPVILPGFSTGYVELVIEPVNSDCIPLALGEHVFGRSALAVFPNPVRSFLQLEIPEEIAAEADRVVIMNSVGQVVRTAALQQASEPIDVRQLEPGIYFIRAESGFSPTRSVPFIKF